MTDEKNRKTDRQILLAFKKYINVAEEANIVELFHQSIFDGYRTAESSLLPIIEQQEKEIESLKKSNNLIVDNYAITSFRQEAEIEALKKEVGKNDSIHKV